MSEIKRYYEGLKMALKGIRTNMKPSNRKILEEYGDLEIIKTYIVRTPLKDTVRNILDTVHNLTMNNAPHDLLFHLYCVFQLSNNKQFIVEKNEDINITDFEKWKPVDDYYEMKTPSNLSLNAILLNTIEYMTPERFYTYNAFSTNCQDFVLSILKSNGYNVTQNIEKWILQDVKNLLPSWGKKVASFATSLFNRIKTIWQGKGFGGNQQLSNEVIEFLYN